mmetsp:Transcript_18781/g.34060  ORF Transcript_18781/g.34060 Transcript_18781/m.34060 type:complete len:203 (-) Transcript_18781:130-738(-)
MGSPKHKFTLPTEENEAFELITIDRVTVFRFNLEPATHKYLLYGGLSHQHQLNKLLAAREIADSEFRNTLSSLERVIIDNAKKPTRGLKQDPVAMKLITISWVFMLICFILIIIGAYYADNDEMCYVGLALAIPGLLLHVLIMLKNGDWRRDTTTSSKVDDSNWLKVETALSEVNAFWKKLGFRWRIEESTLGLMLQDLKAS